MFPKRVLRKFEPRVQKALQPTSSRLRTKQESRTKA